MVRFVWACGLVGALALGAAADEKDVPKDLQPFQGTWKAVAGKKGGENAPLEELAKLGLTFAGDKLTISERGRDKVGSFKVDPKADPKTIDLISPDGEAIKGIYKFDKDGKLTIGFVKGNGAERPKTFDDKEAAFLTLEKEKK